MKSDGIKSKLEKNFLDIVQNKVVLWDAISEHARWIKECCSSIYDMYPF